MPAGGAPGGQATNGQTLAGGAPGRPDNQRPDARRRRTRRPDDRRRRARRPDDQWRPDDQRLEARRPRRQKPGARLVEFIYIVAFVVQVTLVIGAILRLLSANINHPIVNLFYILFDFLLSPFVGMVDYIHFRDNIFIDFTPLIAILVYALLTYITTRLTMWLFGLLSRRKRATPN